MKKILALMLSLALCVMVLAGCSGNGAGAGDAANMKVAMVTDYGDITDQSFNQTTYEACKAWAEANKVDFTYFKPQSNSDEDRVSMIEKAVDEGYTVIVMPGYAFAPAIEKTAGNYPDVTMIALDVSAGDFSADYKLPSNLYSAVYQEELCGYMAGYAAVKLGYTKLGFLGGMAVPAVIRYGYGFVQGCNDAAVELGNASDVQVNYVYGGQFFGDEAITAQMDTWYSNGTEIVFACGGGIYTSACEAAQKVDGKVIGVDSDQSGTISQQYGDDSLCVTSAMKGLAPTVDTTLTDLFAGNWSNYAGKIENLGIVSGDDPSLNYVQLPTETWSMEKFTVDDYKDLVSKLYDGSITVDNSTDKMPATEITVKEYDNIH